VARSWLRVENDGKYFVLTNVGGFDLPPHDGPFQIIHFAKDDEVLEGPEVLPDRFHLAAWLE
jgi:hypothetical protein